MIILTKLPWKLYPGYAIWSVIQVAPVMKTAQPRGPKCSQMWKLSSSSGQRGRRGRRKQSHLDLEVRQVNFLSWGSFPSSLWIDRSMIAACLVPWSQYLNLTSDYKIFWALMHCVKWAGIGSTKRNLPDFRRNPKSQNPDSYEVPPELNRLFSAPVPSLRSTPSPLGLSHISALSLTAKFPNPLLTQFQSSCACNPKTFFLW